MKASEGNNIRVGQSEAEQRVSCLHHPGKINTAYRAVMRFTRWTVYSPSSETHIFLWTMDTEKPQNYRLYPSFLCVGKSELNLLFFWHLGFTNSLFSTCCFCHCIYIKYEWILATNWIIKKKRNLYLLRVQETPHSPTHTANIQSSQCCRCYWPIVLKTVWRNVCLVNVTDPFVPVFHCFISLHLWPTFADYLRQLFGVICDCFPQFWRLCFFPHYQSLAVSGGLHLVSGWNLLCR